MLEVDFDELVEASRMAQNKMGEQALWQAVMGIGAWHFVASGEGEDAEPAIGVADGNPTLIVFTEEDRAMAFARHRARSKGGTPATLHMDIADAVEYGRFLEDHGVKSMLFNSGQYAFGASMSKVKEYFGQYR